jgi:uncharacterized membrane protein
MVSMPDEHKKKKRHPIIGAGSIFTGVTFWLLDQISRVQTAEGVLATSKVGQALEYIPMIGELLYSCLYVLASVLVLFGVYALREDWFDGVFYRACTGVLGDPIADWKWYYATGLLGAFLTLGCLYMADTNSKSWMVFWAAMAATIVFAVVLILAFAHSRVAQARATDKQDAVDAVTTAEGKKTKTAIEERDGYKSQFEALQGQVESLSKDKMALTRELQKAETDHDAVLQNIRTLTSSNRMISSELETSKFAVTAATRDAQSLRDQMETYEAAVAKLDAKDANNFKAAFLRQLIDRLKARMKDQVHNPMQLELWNSNLQNDISLSAGGIRRLFGDNAPHALLDMDQHIPASEMKPFNGLALNAGHAEVLNQTERVIVKLEKRLSELDSAPPSSPTNK